MRLTLRFTSLIWPVDVRVPQHHLPKGCPSSSNHFCTCVQKSAGHYSVSLFLGPLFCSTHQFIYPSVTVPLKHFSYAFNSFFCNLKSLPIPLPRTACFCLFFKFLLHKHLTKIKEKGNGLTHKLSCFNYQIMLIQKLNILA